jgi:LAGLIDADG DNA endonuclease family
LPSLPTDLIEIAIGMILSDACMYKVSKEAIIKFEQGYLQEEFIFHLFNLFKLYCFMTEPGKRITLYGPRKGLIKSFWFKTFSHVSFTEI